MSDERQAPPTTTPPPIEPLSDVAWLRVERGVWAELDAAEAPIPARRSRRAVWLGGTALAAAAAVALYVAVGDRGARAPAVRTVATEAPARVVTDVGASEVSFGDARITVAPRSAVLLSGAADTGVLVVVERGSAQFAVAPRDDRPRFVVQAGEVSVRVVGTEFSVARYGDRARVDVLKGTVEIVAPGERTMVHAGETWPAQATAAIAPAAAPGPAPSIDDGATDGAGSDEGGAPGVTSAPPPAPHRGHHRTAHPGSAAPTADAPTADAPTATTPAAPAPAADDPAARAFAAAAALEATDPAAALAGYARLAAGTGPWAANALYAAARLHYDRGDAAAARRLLASYLGRFPHGANAEDAAALLARLPAP